MSTELSPPRSRRGRFRPTSTPLLVFLALLASAPGQAATDRAPGPHPSVGNVQDLLDLEVPEQEGFRVVAISDAVVYALFDSAEVRSAVFEGIPRELLSGGGTALGLTLPARVLAEAYAKVADTGGVAGAFRDALTDAGLFSPWPLTEAGLRPVLITMIRSSDLGAIYDFSVSNSMQAITTRGEELRSGQSGSTTEANALAFMEGGHPTRALFDTWRFDDLPDLLAEGSAREARENEVLQARRAGLRLEAVNALFLADPDYEIAMLDWIESGLTQADINRLAQLLQIAGYEQLTAELLVQQSAPHLFDASVLVAKLYQRFEGLTRPVGSKGLRKLSPDRFIGKATIEKAEIFYSSFFVAAGKNRFRLELTPEVQTFVRRLSDEIRSLSQPHLVQLLGADFDLDLTSGPDQPRSSDESDS